MKLAPPNPRLPVYEPDDDITDLEAVRAYHRAVTEIIRAVMEKQSGKREDWFGIGDWED